MSPPDAPRTRPSGWRPILRTQLPSGVFAYGRDPVRLSWQSPTGGGAAQLAYEIGWAGGDADGAWASTGRIVGDEQIGVIAPGHALGSREVRRYRVRVESDADRSDWSTPVRVEAGLLEPTDWIARPVTLPDDVGAERQAPAPLLRRAFHLDAEVVSARLHITALGVHQVSINGRPVSEDLLAPGWTPYRQRLLADTYDVTDLVACGDNVIGAVIGDGWYRGRIGWNPDGDRCHYGDQIGLIAQLEATLADGRIATIQTDGTWRATTGEIRAADLYDGCTIDLRGRHVDWDRPGFDDGAWRPAHVLDLDPAVIEPRVAPPVRRIAELPAESLSRIGTTTRLDACQNVAGWVRLAVRGQRGTSVVVRHAEVLELDGSLHTRSLRSAKATDTYVLADGEVTVLEPAFTFHGFRYAEVETEAEILEATVIAISSDTPPRAAFACSDPALTRLYENVVWSQRDNFVSVPTDCPQRDERLGWTGDAQAFAPTASTLFDAEAFWMSWLRDLDIEQDDTLGVSSVVPDMVLDGEMRFGRAGWADAATIVPWAVYESYGDRAVLSAQSGSMRRWVDALVARRGPDGLLPPSQQFGDWLDPDAPGDRPWEAKVDPSYLANAFFAHSARLLADAVERLEPERPDAGTYRRLGSEVAARPGGAGGTTPS